MKEYTIKEIITQQFRDKVHLIAFLLCAALGTHQYNYLLSFEQSTVNATLKKTLKEVNTKLTTFEANLEEFFSQAEKTVNSIAALLQNKEPNYSALIPNMQKAFGNGRCTAIGAHFSDEYDKLALKKYFSEYTYKDSKKTLYAPFLKKEGRKEKTFPYDYTDTSEGSRNNGWYSETIHTGSWFGPYFGEANKEFVISYRAPFRWSEEKQRNQGNIVADYSLESLRDSVADIRLLKSGYGIILTPAGRVISHPVKEYLARNIRDIEDLNIDISTIKSLQPDTFYTMSKINNNRSTSKTRERLALYKKLNIRDWIVLVIVNKKEALIRPEEGDEKASFRKLKSQIHHIKLRILLASFASLFFIVAFFSRKLTNRQWYTAITFSILCVISICFIWYNHLNEGHQENTDDIPIFNKTDLEATLNAFKRTPNKSIEEKNPIKIKTGVFIESVKFSSANTVFVTGYAWQKMPEEWISTDVSLKESFQEHHQESYHQLNFVFPEAESYNLDIVYSDKHITRWYFHASLRQSFNYLNYPFDDEDVWLRIRPEGFYKNNIVLVPDFDAYPNFESHSDNGLESGIFIEGWDIRKTFYSFRNNSYSSNFGRNIAKKIISNKPDLYFNISIRRQFIGVFIAYMIPLVVIAFLLFGVLTIRTRDKNRIEFSGYSAANSLGYSASLFFVLIVSHMSLRETLQTNSVIYLEYFFFCLYVAIALVSAISIAFSYQKFSNSTINRWADLFYWPLIMLSIFIATIIRFS